MYSSGRADAFAVLDFKRLKACSDNGIMCGRLAAIFALTFSAGEVHIPALKINLSPLGKPRLTETNSGQG